MYLENNVRGYYLNADSFVPVSTGVSPLKLPRATESMQIWPGTAHGAATVKLELYTNKPLDGNSDSCLTTLIGFVIADRYICAVCIFVDF
jgi:hypothetical protein